MLSIPVNLKPSPTNRPSSYIPVRYKGDDFEWDIITGMVLGYALKKEIQEYDEALFREDCRLLFAAALDKPTFWEVLERMYFDSGAVLDISPLFLLFKANPEDLGRATPSNVRMGELFNGLLGAGRAGIVVDDKLNFVEQQMLDVLQRKLKDVNDPPEVDGAYLPYLAQAFQEDIQFLAMRPKYLLQELTNTLRFYAFGYCSQMALNIDLWPEGEPKSRPLYFILDTEKASNERSKIQLAGYKAYAACSTSLFPILSALEVLQFKDQKRPLWQVFSESLACPDQTELLSELNQYLLAFATSRSLPSPPTATTVAEAFARLIDLAKAQFSDAKSERGKVNHRYTRTLESEICGTFVKSRGRAGRVLVLNQDQLLLLTNLAIGANDKLRLQELMIAFQRRGVYLDGQSQQVLVNFYERMGNIERMSDSGDAVYVRKTV
jgi:DNA phosphorothioation-dependent restriction protein DptG